MPIAVLLLGNSGIILIWVAVAILSDRACGWLALFAAAVVALLLRLTHMPAGTSRNVLAVVACALAIASSLWAIAATRLGFVFGLDPMTSAFRLGPVLAWEMSRLLLQPLDWLWIGLSLPLAVWWGRGEKSVV